MLLLYKMGNTEDPFLKSMIPGGLMYPDVSDCPASELWQQLLCFLIDFDTIKNTFRKLWMCLRFNRLQKFLIKKESALQEGGIRYWQPSAGFVGATWNVYRCKRSGTSCMKFLYWEISESSYTERRCDLKSLLKIFSVYVCRTWNKILYISVFYNSVSSKSIANFFSLLISGTA